MSQSVNRGANSASLASRTFFAPRQACIRLRSTRSVAGTTAIQIVPSTFTSTDLAKALPGTCDAWAACRAGDAPGGRPAGGGSVPGRGGTVLVFRPSHQEEKGKDAHHENGEDPEGVVEAHRRRLPDGLPVDHLHRRPLSDGSRDAPSRQPRPPPPHGVAESPVAPGRVRCEVALV